MNGMLQLRHQKSVFSSKWFVVKHWSKGKDVPYFGSLDVESLAGWITRKISIQNNQVTSHRNLEKMVREAKLLAVFVSPKEKADAEFR